MSKSNREILKDLLNLTDAFNDHQHWFGLPQTIQNWMTRSNQPDRLPTIRALYQILVSEFDHNFTLANTCRVKGCQNPYHHRVTKRPNCGISKLRKRRFREQLSSLNERRDFLIDLLTLAGHPEWPATTEQINTFLMSMGGAPSDAFNDEEVKELLRGTEYTEATTLFP